MIRLFVALTPAPEICTKLSGLGKTIGGARPIPDDQVHLTLRFIGEVEANTFHDIRTRLRELKSPPLRLTVEGTGHFPPRGNPKVIWAGVRPAGDVMILRNRVNNVLSRCGIEPERRKFHPHFTLARLKDSSPNRVADFLAGNALLKSPPFIVDRVHLYSSSLTPDGAIHRLEESYPLTDE